MVREMVKGEKEKMLERNLYIHNTVGSRCGVSVCDDSSEGRFKLCNDVSNDQRSDKEQLTLVHFLCT